MDNVIFLGDIHGLFKTTMDKIERMHISDCFIVQVGDFGIGYSNYETELKHLDTLNTFCAIRNIIMYVTRGNHDDPFFFNGEHIYSNLKLMPDYSVIEIDNKKILLVGGAVSVDRERSKEIEKIEAEKGNIIKKYWQDEIFNLDLEKIKTLEDIEIVVTHSSPNYCFPYVSNFIVDINVANDNLLKQDIIKEREDIANLFKILSIKNNISHHIYGHFHNSHEEEHNGCKHILLGISEFKML